MSAKGEHKNFTKYLLTMKQSEKFLKKDGRNAI